MAPADRPLIGGTVSTRGGFDKAVDNAVRIGAEVFQTHPTSSLTWRPLQLDDIVLGRFRDKYAGSGVHAHYLHAVYLINLATSKESLLRQSVASLLHYMELADQLGAAGVVLHPGSHLGAGFSTSVAQIGRALREVAHRSPGEALVIVENSAGAGGCVGRALAEIADILEAADHDRVRICLDTQHAFASGYDLRTPGGVQAMLAEFDRLIGMQRLALVHANDSRRELGSNVDRHANIGDGHLGVDAFTLLINEPRLAQVPWILEVPGTGDSGPDRDNINRLRACAGRAPLPAGADDS